MRAGEHFPDDQAEVVFSDSSIDWIAENIDPARQDELIDTVVRLLVAPWGKHALSNRPGEPFAGLNTVEVFEREYRVVYRATVSQGTGLLEVLAIGERKESRVYAIVAALIASGKLDDLEMQIWDLMRIFETSSKQLGLEDWDYLPTPAPPGLQRAAVAVGALEADTAALLSTDEINAALEAAWSGGGAEADKTAALQAALLRLAGQADPDRVVRQRQATRCGAFMPRSKKNCIRAVGHAGAHRATL
ncbi:MAG: hypothetical protein LBE25_09285 [Arthrobacter sp.]|nr:hypothetical protein [Arthrobacter sp.]